MQTPSSEQRAFFERAVSTYQAALAADTSAQAYLTGRGFGPEVARRWRLGVATSPLAGDEPLRGRLIIPYLTPAGVVNYRGRCLQQHNCSELNHPKYVGLEGLDTNLFNVGDLKTDSEYICITEGELDAVTLSMCGIPAVGVAGVRNWKDHYGRCLEDFRTVYSFADEDKAGRELRKFLAREMKARPIRMPGGMDVNDFYREHGAEGLRKLIAQ